MEKVRLSPLSFVVFFIIFSVTLVVGGEEFEKPISFSTTSSSVPQQDSLKEEEEIKGGQAQAALLQPSFDEEEGMGERAGAMITTSSFASDKSSVETDDEKELGQPKGSSAPSSLDDLIVSARNDWLAKCLEKDLQWEAKRIGTSPQKLKKALFKNSGILGKKY